MKKLILFFLFLALPALVACEKELKEHPLPQSLKKKIQMQNDPEVKAREISGTITVDPEYATKLPENAKLFIYARPEGTEGGPPLAVKRHSLVEFPFDYRIGPMDVMLEGNVFEGRMTLTARLDQDGNAQATAGDLEGTRNAQAGEKPVDIVLDRRLGGSPKSVTGTLELDPQLAQDLPDHWKLFLIARREGVERGLPVAVKLLEGIRFPYAFTLGSADVMMPGTAFEGRLTLTARIDRDGDARAEPGDIEGETTVTVGDREVTIRLDRVVGSPSSP